MAANRLTAHTPVYDDTNLGEGYSSPTNPMIDPIALYSGGAWPRYALLRADPAGCCGGEGEDGIALSMAIALLALPIAC